MSSPWDRIALFSPKNRSMYQWIGFGSAETISLKELLIGPNTHIWQLFSFWPRCPRQNWSNCVICQYLAHKSVLGIKKRVLRRTRLYPPVVHWFILKTKTVDGLFIEINNNILHLYFIFLLKYHYIAYIFTKISLWTAFLWIEKVVISQELSKRLT